MLLFTFLIKTEQFSSFTRTEGQMNSKRYNSLRFSVPNPVFPLHTVPENIM